MGSLLGSTNGHFSLEDVKSVGRRSRNFSWQHYQPDTLMMVGNYLWTLATGIGVIVAERDENDCLYTHSPSPVMPHQLAQLSGIDISSLIETYTERLSCTFTRSEGLGERTEYSDRRSHSPSDRSWRDISPGKIVRTNVRQTCQYRRQIMQGKRLRTFFFQVQFD